MEVFVCNWGFCVRTVSFCCFVGGLEGFRGGVCRSTDATPHLVYRNCIGFGSGVLGGFAGGFGGFCFCFCNLIFGSGGGLVFGWAGLCWAGRFFFLLWNLILASWGRLAGFAFCFCRFSWAGLGWAAAGLGWAAAGLGWAGLSSRTF